MSELKADNTFVFGDECLAYKKSEADKVIADLMAENEKLKKTLQHSEDELESYFIFEKEIKQELRRHKYKRCLAMAMWCWAVKELNRYGDQDYMDFAEKWRKRWLELADKFKEAK